MTHYQMGEDYHVKQSGEKGSLIFTVYYKNEEAGKFSTLNDARLRIAHLKKGLKKHELFRETTERENKFMVFIGIISCFIYSQIIIHVMEFLGL